MAPSTRRQWGAAIAALMLLWGCAEEKPEVRDKSQLAGTLVAAADSALATNDSATAANYYRSALTRDPDNTAAAIGLMRALRLIGGLDEARVVAEKTLATKRGDPAVAAEAAKVKLATGQLDDAIRLLNQAVSADDKDWRSLSALGLAYDRLGDFGHADECYKSALAISPDNASVLNNYALSRAMANDLGTARNLLERAVATPNADLRVRQNLALVYALTGDVGRAEEIARRDLPPAMVKDTLDYYRQLAAATPPKHP